jgi:hypothetical protein
MKRSLGEAITEFLELLMSELEIPGGFNSTPALLKLDGVSLVEMSFSVALHVHGTELDIAVGKQALSHR